MATKQEKSFENEWIIYSNPIVRRGMPHAHPSNSNGGLISFADYTRHMNVGEVAYNTPVSKHVRELSLHEERVAGQLKSE
jgi:hypothetical protein